MPTSDDATVVRFWGTTLSAGVPLKLSLSSTELHVTQAVLVGGKRATIYASTNGVPSIALTVLSSAAPTALIDVCFFDDDETVELRVDGEGANVALSGSICVHVPPSDEEGESDEDAPKATFVEQTGDADEEEEDELDETEIDAMYADDDEDDDVDGEDEGDDDEEDDEEDVDDEEAAAAPPAKPAKPAAAAAPKADAPKAAAPAATQAGKRARENERAPAEAKNDTKKAKEQAAPPAPSPAAAGMSPAAGGNFTAIASSSGKVMMKETRVGGGAVARPGQKVTVAYVGSLKNGTVFDRSKNFSFKLGKGEVIRGWDLGVAGMRVGGSRELIIHADFAYGSKGAPPTIPPGATLKFSVDLLRA